MKTLNALILALTLSCAHAEDDFSKETVKSTPLAPGMHMLEGAGGNMTALIAPEGTLLVDDDFAPMAGKLVAKLKELAADVPRYVVNTHFHYDHTGGNEVFGGTSTIIAAKRVRDRLEQEQVLWHQRHPPAKPHALPNLTFETSLTLHLGNEIVQVTHYPHGHTDGDTVVFFEKAKILSMGDLYFSGMFPIFHDEHEGGIDGYIQNIQTILRRLPPDARIVPGHGPLSNREELAKYLEMIKFSVGTVRKGIENGMTLAQLQKRGLSPQWQSYGHGYVTPERWIEMIYNGIKK